MPVRTFSTVFPKSHKRAGEPTNFVELILSGIKMHTIRAGHNWKDADMLDPRIWTGKPYSSKQKQIKEPFPAGCQDIFIRWCPAGVFIFIDGVLKSQSLLNTIAKNDGLTDVDFDSWFFSHGEYGTFSGQVLHFTELRY